MNFNLPERTILLTIAGSRAYGMHTSTSDVDLKGVCAPPREVVLGFNTNFEQADGKSHAALFLPLLTEEERTAAQLHGLEGTVYSVQKFIALAADCNPNILDALFCRDEEVRLCSRLGKMLRDAAPLFLSTKARFSFSGYAMAQLHRIKQHKRWLLEPPAKEPVRADFGLRVDRNSVRADQLNTLMTLSQGELRSLGLDDAGVDTVHREKAYHDARADWEKFQQWKKNRNPARAELEAKYLYDTKHGAHLVRLMRMGVEIMQTGKVNVWRGDIDAEELLAIRNGAWSYEQIVAWAELQDVALNAMYIANPAKLPKHPPREDLNALCVRLTEQSLWTTGAMGV